eukprot:TRINITY_DN67950_c0_g1_i1.p1 TRINITY_DN67950_c0_g1~~TRINITY_DN67950_c0_g1_i1.p1  ORF type:complete len:153 (-),score=23.73 TRINITY_DN67950_c0_g1_i1:7-465(-)
MAIPMKEDTQSLVVFRGMLETDRMLGSRWRKQADYSSFKDPQLSHHEGLARPGQRMHLGFSRSHPELNGALAEIVSVDSKQDGGLIRVKVAHASGKPKSMKVRASLLIPGTGLGCSSLKDVTLPNLHEPGCSEWRRPQSSPTLTATAKGCLK